MYADPNISDHRNGQSVVFAIFFVAFTLGLVLPMIYFVGGPFYATMQMTVPYATSWFQAISPWPMVIIASFLVICLLALRYLASPKILRRTSWGVIVATAVVTLWGVFQFVSPMISVLSMAAWRSS